MSPKPLGLRLSEHIRSCSKPGKPCSVATCAENQRIREEYYERQTNTGRPVQDNVRSEA